jgi:hypothetical protein
MGCIINIIKRFGFVIFAMIVIALFTVGSAATIVLLIGFAIVGVIISIIKYIFTGNGDIGF